MASNYWIKLYLDILSDPKMGRLSDNHWRRFIECCLLAGDLGQDGRLPPLCDIAWKLRVEEEALKAEFDHLARIGLLDFINTPLDEHWVVTNFAKRQAPLTASERGKLFRKRQRKQQYYEDETPDERKPNETFAEERRGESESEERREDTEAQAAIVYSHFQNEICMLTPSLSEIVGDWIDEYPTDWITEAIDIAVSRSKRRPDYIAGILKNWKTEGKDNGSKPELTTAEQLKKAGYESAH